MAARVGVAGGVAGEKSVANRSMSASLSVNDGCEVVGCAGTDMSTRNDLQRGVRWVKERWLDTRTSHATIHVTVVHEENGGHSLSIDS